MSRTRQKIKNLILHVEQLKEKEFSHEFEENPQAFPIIAEMIKNRECEFLKPLNIRLRAFRIRELFEVQGTFRTSVRLPCSRCLKDFGTPLRPENPLPYMNQKGLVDRNGKPKDAYYVFASHWSKKPFCYIESKTWTHRTTKFN